MDLKNFVSDTITQIIEGIADAQIRIKENPSHATINPDPMHYTEAGNISQSRRIRDIEFDVALSVESTGSSGAKVSVIGGFFGGKVEAGTGSSEGRVNRVNFSVPVRCPG